MARAQLVRKYAYASPYGRALAATGSLIYNSGKKAAPYLAAGISGAFGSRRQTGTRESAVNSYQHDVQNRYRYKRMPKRRRKRWVKFTKQVNHVSLQMQPLQVYTAKTVQNLSVAANQQSYTGFILGGTTFSGNDEIFQCFKDAYNIVLGSVPPYRLYFKSMCLDVQMSNTGVNPCVIDLYRLRSRQDYSSAASLATEYTASISELQTTTGGRTYSATDPAGTPFDVPNFLSYWKVLHKREIIIAPGNITTVQMRKPTNRHVEGKILQSHPQCLPGAEAFFIMVRGAPINNGGTPQLGAVTLTVGSQTVMHYAIPPGKITEAGAST